MKLGHEVQFSARDFTETVALAERAGLAAEVIGGHGGPTITGKAGNLASRSWELAHWARPRRFDLAVSHNSYSQILASRALRIPNVTSMDYEYQPANHLAFRLSGKIIVPACFPLDQLKSYGAAVRKVRTYDGTKEDVYLADFQPDSQFLSQLSTLGVTEQNILVLLRPQASSALYHRFENSLFDETLAMLLRRPNVKVILLPRDDAQRKSYSSRPDTNLIIPEAPLRGPDLIAACDLVISAGGTINREAAALGVPAASIYAGQWAAVDQMLVEEGRLKRIASKEDLQRLVLTKKSNASARRAVNVRAEVVKLILE